MTSTTTTISSSSNVFRQVRKTGRARRSGRWSADIARRRAEASGTECHAHARRARGWAIAALGVFAIAVGAVMAAVSEVGPLATAAGRFAIATPICLAIALGTALRKGALKPVNVKSEMMLAALAFSVAVALWYCGQRMSSVASTSALHNLSPVVIVVAIWIAKRRPPPRLVVCGLVCALIGVTMLALLSGDGRGRTLLGDSLAVLSAVLLALYYYQVANLSAELGAFALMSIVGAIGAVVLALAAISIEGTVLPTSLGGAAILFCVAICGQVLGQGLLAIAARSIGGFGIAAIILLEPAFSSILAALLIGEVVSSLALAAIAFVLIGVGVCSMRR